MGQNLWLPRRSWTPNPAPLGQESTPALLLWKGVCSHGGSFGNYCLGQGMEQSDLLSRVGEGSWSGIKREGDPEEVGGMEVLAG